MVCVCRLWAVIFDVSHIFLISYFQPASSLSYIRIMACMADPECNVYLSPHSINRRNRTTYYTEPKTSGYPIATITKLNTQIQNEMLNENMTSEHSSKKWITITFHSPITSKITTLFYDTNLKIAFLTNNSIQSILNIQHQHEKKYTQSGTYQMICHTCHNSYIGQTGHRLEIRYKTH